MDRDELLRLLRAFEVEGLEYVLIGATAMGFHGLVRATEDVDLFVRATPENLTRLRRSLKAAYPDSTTCQGSAFIFEGVLIMCAECEKLKKRLEETGRALIEKANQLLLIKRILLGI